MVGGTESQQEGPAGGGTKQPDCVLWRPDGVEAPPRLLASLKRRGVAITDCTSPMLAMATACRLARLRRQRPEEAPPGEDGIILLLAHPRRLDMAADVVEAIEATVGAVACWRYDEEDEAALRAVTAEDVADWRAAAGDGPEQPASEAEALRPVILGIPASSVAPRRHGDSHPNPPHPHPSHRPAPPALRLVGDAPDAGPRRDFDEDEPAEMPEEPDPGTLLTEEELMMLLSSDPTEWEAEPDREES